MTIDQVNRYAWELRLVPHGEVVPIAMVATLIRQLEAAEKTLCSPSEAPGNEG